MALRQSLILCVVARYEVPVQIRTFPQIRLFSDRRCDADIEAWMQLPNLGADVFVDVFLHDVALGSLPVYSTLLMLVVQAEAHGTEHQIHDLQRQMATTADKRESTSS